MGKNKPRHNPDKPQNKFKHCTYDDGSVQKECRRPWAHKCTGDMYMCRKLYFQYLATLSEKDKEIFTEEWGTDIGAPRTNYE